VLGAVVTVGELGGAAALPPGATVVGGTEPEPPPPPQAASTETAMRTEKAMVTGRACRMVAS